MRVPIVQRHILLYVHVRRFDFTALTHSIIVCEMNDVGRRILSFVSVCY